MYTHEFRPYHTAKLFSNLDFVTLNIEQIFVRRWHQIRVNRKRDGRIILAPAQKCISFELGCGLVYLLIN